MIQRIQSIYLLLVVVLMTVTVFSPLLNLVGGGDSGLLVVLSSMGVFAKQVVFATWGIVAVAGLSALLSLINVFLYKKRKLQLKVGNVVSILLLLFYAILFVYYSMFTSTYNYTFSGVQYGIVLPLVAFICNILARLGIKKDEKLVRSLDRIR